MTCAIAMTAALFFVTNPAVSVPTAQDTVAEAVPVADLSAEPAFAALIDESRRLKGMVDIWLTSAAITDPDFINASPYQAFRLGAQSLTVANMNGHLELKRRGTDGDLTCILRGIAEDMPKKVEQLEQAAPGQPRQHALEELAYLLNDNAEVILAPPVRP